jgi:hypothetical protein
MISSNTAVRTIIAHAIARPRFMVSTIARPLVAGARAA